VGAKGSCKHWRALLADEEFLAMLKEKCLGTDAEWEERQKIRQLEMRHVPRLRQS
jgi:hypothetical protein